MNYYVMYYDDNGEPALDGPHDDADERDEKARFILRNSPCCDLLRLDIDEDGRPQVSSYSDEELLTQAIYFVPDGMICQDGTRLAYPDEEGRIVRYDAQDEEIDCWMPGEDGYEAIIAQLQPEEEIPTFSIVEE